MYRFFKRKPIISLLICAPLSALLAQEAIPEQTSPVNYSTALNRAIQNDPVLRGFEAFIEAAEGQVEQASLRPNPVVGAEVENFLGTGPLRDVQGLEVTLGITQLIETAGKRAKRTELARTERALIEWDRERRLASLESEIRAAFVEVLVAQQTLELRQEQLTLAERSEKETDRLVEAARSAEVELTRAQLAVRQQRFAISRAERTLASKRGQLATLWGGSVDADFEVIGSIEFEAKLPELIELVSLLPRSVSLAQYEGQRLQRQAALELEQAKATPDFEVFGGGRYFNEESGDAAFVVGVQIPWPLFDKNQGNIRTARAQLRSVDYAQASNRRELVIALSETYQDLVAAYAEAKTVETDLLPAAEQTLEDTEEGYERGQFNLLSVLESRRTLFEIRETYLDALSRYAIAQARIETLTRPTSIN
ncbi:TolC family protein [Coraliomargarita sp. W4R53]